MRPVGPPVLRRDGVDDTEDVAVSYLPDRHWRRRLRAARPYVLVAAVVALIAVACWIVLFSAVLGVRHVRVAGERRLTSAAVVHAAAITPGTPLARVNLSTVAARVERLPEVASASVTRSWPHTLAIVVTERKPLADVHDQGRWWLMDDTGALFAASRDLDHAYPIASIQASRPAEARAEVGRVLASLPRILRTDVRRVTVRSVDSITLTLQNGTIVRWGNADQAGLKARVLTVLMAASTGPHKKPPAVYDVSVPQEPTTSMH